MVANKNAEVYCGRWVEKLLYKLTRDDVWRTTGLGPTVSKGPKSAYSHHHHLLDRNVFDQLSPRVMFVYFNQKYAIDSKF